MCFFCRFLIHPTWCSSCPGLGHNSIRIFVENKYLAIIVKFVIFQSPFLLSSSWPTSGKTSKRLPMVQYLKLHPFILIMLSFQRCTILIIEESQILHSTVLQIYSFYHKEVIRLDLHIDYNSHMVGTKTISFEIRGLF